jgi:hypothetical protein
VHGTCLLGALTRRHRAVFCGPTPMRIQPHAGAPCPAGRPTDRGRGAGGSTGGMGRPLKSRGATIPAAARPPRRGHRAREAGRRRAAAVPQAPSGRRPRAGRTPADGRDGRRGARRRQPDAGRAALRSWRRAGWRR